MSQEGEAQKRLVDLRENLMSRIDGATDRDAATLSKEIRSITAELDEMDRRQEGTARDEFEEVLAAWRESAAQSGDHPAVGPDPVSR
jgi:uncharacterized protein YukE